MYRTHPLLKTYAENSMLATGMWSALFFLLSGVAAASLHDNSQSYLTRLADTFIADGVDPDFGYQDAVLYLGFEKAYELSQDDRYLDWYQGQIDGHVVQEDGTIKDWNATRYVLDEYRMGHNYLYLYNVTGDEKYKSAADVVRRMLDAYPRTPSGGFWHQESLPDQMWLDGIYMADTFYAKWTHLYDQDNETAWADILQQYALIEAHARNPPSAGGLYVHGWAERTGAAAPPWADPVTGRSPHVWGRAVGWYFMALAEILEYFPASHPGYAQLQGAFTSLAGALQRARDPASGSWWQILDAAPAPGRDGNYVESSASAMFTWGLLAGVRRGYLDRGAFLDTARDAYRSLVDNFVAERAGDGALVLNGTVDECGLGDNATFEYYIGQPVLTNEQNGAGPFMLASYEWETWAKDV